MKKISKYFMTASVMIAMGMQSVFAADEAVCDLIDNLGPVIRTLRTLAFLGAAFVMMDWAWGFIKAGDVGKDDLKNKGIGLFVGFFLLFAVGWILHWLGSTGAKEYFDCVEKAFAVAKGA